MLTPAAAVASRHLPSLPELLRPRRSIHHLLSQVHHAHRLIHGSSSFTAVASQQLASSAVSADAGYGDRRLFDRIPDPRRFMYNTVIRAFCDSRCPQEALRLHRGMLRRGILPNEFTLPSVVKACTRARAWSHARAAHGVALKLGFVGQVFVGNALLHSYASAGSLADSRRFFDEMVEKNVVSWNSMINGYAQAENAREVRALFGKMRREGILEDEFTLVALLLACSQDGNLQFGRVVHCHMLVSGSWADLILGNALVNMYGKCGELWMARRCFQMMPLKNVVSWTSILCAQAKHGSVDAARDLFDQMPERNMVSWNAMISCYVQCGRCREALDLYNRMQSHGLAPDEVTLVAALSACAQIGDLAVGKMIHLYIRDNIDNPDASLVNSLMDMYAKCGQVDTAISLFSEMRHKNVVSWNVIIGGLAMHGHALDSVMFFRSMVRDSFSPNEITFVALLSACSHGGLLEAGQHYFEAMRHVYNVKYEVEHYACMVDLLGRRGYLEKAVCLIKEMPMKPDVVIWGALLGACRMHGCVEIGRQVIKQLLELEGISGGLFVLISNLLYETCQWEEMKRLRKLMKEQGTRKDMGVSSIEVNSSIHEFGVEDIRHESSSEIYETVDQLSCHLTSLHLLTVHPEELYVADYEDECGWCFALQDNVHCQAGRLLKPEDVMVRWASHWTNSTDRSRPQMQWSLSPVTLMFQQYLGSLKLCNKNSASVHRVGCAMITELETPDAGVGAGEQTKGSNDIHNFTHPHCTRPANFVRLVERNGCKDGWIRAHISQFVTPATCSS